MRPEGWEMRLVAEIEAAMSREWSWGAHDCASFAGRCVSAMLEGPSVWAAYLGRHTTEAGAARVMRREGASDLIELLDKNSARIAPNMARRGDVAAVRVDPDGQPDGAGEPALGIVEGPFVVIASAVGVTRVPRSEIAAAWPVESA